MPKHLTIKDNMTYKEISSLAEAAYFFQNSERLPTRVCTPE